MNKTLPRNTAENRAGKIGAVCLFSGGLDSRLAVRMLRAQAIDIYAMVFSSPFFEIERAIVAAKTMGLPVVVEDFTADIFGLLKNPAHGFGGGMNPCIDCHAAMVRRAGQWMSANGLNFIATGEVVNQRPMSQNRQALALVAKESGYAGFLLRPLSARLLPETEPERLGWVERAKLGDFQGRSRKPQMDLARQYGIDDYPQPAGGCALTDPVFGMRLRDLLEHEGMDKNEIELLRMGRRFRVNGLRLVLGRNSHDNEKLEKRAGPGDVLMYIDDYPSPVGLAPAVAAPETMRLMAGICARYSDAPRGCPVCVRVAGPAGESVLEVLPVEPEIADKMRL